MIGFMTDTTETQIAQDVIGQAILDYHTRGHAEDIQVLCPDFDPDVIPVSHFFRSVDQMPKLEQCALRHCQGHVLDIGAGAGTHALHLMQQGFEVSTLDLSPGAVGVQKARGLKQALCGNIHDPETDQLLRTTGFDTLLLLMNGIGVAGSLDGLHSLLSKAKHWLNPNGVIILDSSDLIFLHEDDAGAISLCLTDHYYGELTYQMIYQDIESAPFPWLFVDFDTLSEFAEDHGFEAELLLTGDHYDYLAKLRLQQPVP